MRAALGLDANIPAAWLFMHQTIRSLAAKISQDVLAPGAVHVAPLLPTVSKLLADPAEGIQTPTQLSFQQVTICLIILVISQAVPMQHLQPRLRRATNAHVACRSNSCSCGSKTLPVLPTTPPGASTCKAV